jgi:hypothetical protein
MPHKLFISYTHKDESYKDDLLAHLAALRRDGRIEDWHDRCIVAGAKWEDRINEELTSSDMILFLVSSDFINSDYCYGKEVHRAIELHDQGKAQVIPIIIRACDWHETPLSRLQALPKDAKPISSWPDKDEAYLNVIKGIKGSLETFVRTQTVLPLAVSSSTTMLNNKFSEWLNDTEIKLTHSKVNLVGLEDIYTWPDIRNLDEDNSDVEYINAKKVLSEGYYLILGEEQHGKSALLKSTFMEMLKEGALPLYLDARDINKTDIKKIFQKALISQYNSIDYETFINHPNKVVLIDNYGQIKINDRYQFKFIGELLELFNHIVLTANDTFGLINQEKNELDSFEAYDLMGIGHCKREEMIKKWVSLGVEESISEQELYKASDKFISTINLAINKNVVPPKPLFILLMLQLFEANQKQTFELTSYGHCYQQLIYQSLDKANVKRTEIDKYLNILTEFAWEVHCKKTPMDFGQVDDFFQRYEEMYLVGDRDKVLENLIKYSILKDVSGDLRFRYPYIYYFFVGKKIAESYMEDKAVQEEVENLIHHLHREDYANILIFITHHTKSTWVIDKIKTVLSELFDKQKEATLEKNELGFLDEFIKEIPELILEKREIKEERDKRNKSLDDEEKNEREPDQPEDKESSEVLANLNQTFKGMEIAGQIIRNRHANLKKTDLQSLAETGADAGLRSLNYIISLFEDSKDNLVEIIEKKIAEPNLTKEQISYKSKHAFMLISYGIINGIVRKIASAIGSRDAISIYGELEDMKGTPAYQLIKIAVQLQHQKFLDMKSIKKAKEELESNLVAIRILKEMVIQHIYLFPVEAEKQQQLARMLNIKEKTQQIMRLKGKKVR